MTIKNIALVFVTASCLISTDALAARRNKDTGDAGGRCIMCGKYTTKGGHHYCPNSDEVRDAKSAAEKIATDRLINSNSKKYVPLTSFCGYKFLEPNNQPTNTVSVIADEPIFDAYNQIELTYSKARGLYKISLITTDNEYLQDIHAEMLRIASLIEATLKVKLSKQITDTDNTVYRKAFKGDTCVLKEATEKTSTTIDEFKNIKVSIRGLRKLVDDSREIRVSVEIKK